MKKIARHIRKCDMDTVFNYETISRNIMARTGISGMSADAEQKKESDAIRRWMKRQPEKKELSSERLEALMTKMILMRETRQ